MDSSGRLCHSRARRMMGATRQDVINDVTSFFVARRLLDREGVDAITMECPGALADEPVSLPRISWSRTTDEGVPAACEADYAVVNRIIDHLNLELGL